MNVVSSYCGDLMLTATADREMMPDPAFYTECIQRQHDELQRAAGG